VATDPAALARVVDLRIADLWTELFRLGECAGERDSVAWALRCAYVQGYGDALREPERGSLCREVAATESRVASTQDALG
jgi:hypothetical protein